jgi:uncharacterized protein YecT (DUF1311 family)
MKRIALAGAVLLAASGFAQAQSLKLSAEDSRAIQSCIKEKTAKSEGGEGCIGIIANPCLDKPEGQSTHGQSQCYQREHLVWDDILNETYRRLQKQLNEKQRKSLREVQRVWIESRKQQCAFFSDFHEGGTIAIPAGASCFNTETARRAFYLLNFLDFGN